MDFHYFEWRNLFQDTNFQNISYTVEEIEFITWGSTIGATFCSSHILSKLQHTTFLGIKLHVPTEWPFIYPTLVLTQGSAVFFCYFSYNLNISNKETKVARHLPHIQTTNITDAGNMLVTSFQHQKIPVLPLGQSWMEG